MVTSWQASAKLRPVRTLEDAHKTELLKTTEVPLLGTLEKAPGPQIILKLRPSFGQILLKLLEFRVTTKGC